MKNKTVFLELKNLTNSMGAGNLYYVGPSPFLTSIRSADRLIYSSKSFLYLAIIEKRQSHDRDIFFLLKLIICCTTLICIHSSIYNSSYKVYFTIVSCKSCENIRTVCCLKFQIPVTVDRSHTSSDGFCYHFWCVLCVTR